MLNDVLKINVNTTHKMRCEVELSGKTYPAELKIADTFKSVTITGIPNCFGLGEEVRGISDNGYMFITDEIISKQYNTSIPGISVEQYFFNQIVFMKTTNWSRIKTFTDPVCKIKLEKQKSHL